MCVYIHYIFYFLCVYPPFLSGYKHLSVSTVIFQTNIINRVFKLIEIVLRNVSVYLCGFGT
jgi:hypothetical protein